MGGWASVLLLALDRGATWLCRPTRARELSTRLEWRLRLAWLCCKCRQGRLGFCRSSLVLVSPCPESLGRECCLRSLLLFELLNLCNVGCLHLAIRSLRGGPSICLTVRRNDRTRTPCRARLGLWDLLVNLGLPLRGTSRFLTRIVTIFSSADV